MIDNYDSFTWNLVQYLSELGADVHVHRNDAISVAEAVAWAPAHIVISPGPCTPSEAGICLPLIREFAGKIPILGVCLGHQAIGAAYGGRIVRAIRPVHGRTSAIVHDGSSVFTGLPAPIWAARYHSLVIERMSLPESLRVLATAGDDGEIMAVEHRIHPVVGVQFHPESAATEYGYAMIDRFLHGERARPRELPTYADGARQAPEVVRPWSAPDREPRVPFVPPPVDLVR